MKQAKSLGQGFSLMEMMVVLLIVSIVAAASAPMISKKMVRSASGTSPWVWAGIKGGIAFNMSGNNEASATIGAINDSVNPSDKQSRLFINGNGEVPFITFKNDNNNLVFRFNNNGLVISDKDTAVNDNATVIGSQAGGASDAVAVGAEAEATGERSVAAGQLANAAGIGSISLGSDARSDSGSIALGFGSRANGDAVINAIAIGSDVTAEGNGAIAIGSRFSPMAGGPQVITRANGRGAVAIRGLATADRAVSLAGTAEGEGSLALLGSAGAEDSLAISGTAAARDAIAIKGNAESERSIAIGAQNQDDLEAWANGTDAIAIGTGAQTNGHDAIAVGSNTESIGNSIAIGNLANTSEAGAGIAIGLRAHAFYTNSVAIGGDAVAGGSYKNQSVHNGSESQPAPETVTVPIPFVGNKIFPFGARFATAIGVDAQAAAENSTAIGSGAYARHPNSTAIGRSAATTTAHQIVLGTADDTVFIPGNLVVGRRSYLNRATIRMNGQGKYTSTERWAEVSFEGDPNDGGNIQDPDIRVVPGPESDISSVYSDRRLKNVGEVFKGGLEQIRKLEVFNYTFKKDPDKTPRVGVMAQDLQKIFPNAVTKGDDGFLRIRMEDMFYALVNAVKELDSKVTALSEQFKTNLDVVAKLRATVDSQNEEIKALKAKNTELEKKNTSLEKKTDDIEKRLAKLESKKGE